MIGCIGIGGVILVPALVFLAGIAIHIAIPAAMFAYILSGLVATIVFARNKSIDWGMAIWLCIGGAPAAFAGAWAVSIFDSRLLAGCLGLLMCENNCPATDMTCPTTCQNNATSQGNSLFQSLINCVLQACPGSTAGDPCFNSSSTACSNCLNQAQMTGGACEQPVTACDNDTP